MMQSSLKGKNRWVVVALLFLLALAVRSFHLTANDIAGDEPFSLFIAQFDIIPIIKYLSSGNNPPLFEILLHYYLNLVGDSPTQVRFLSAMLSALCIIPVFLVSNRFFNLQTAIVSCILLVFSLQHIRFSHEVRVYELLCTTSAFSLYHTLKLTENCRSHWSLLWLIVCDVILLYSHFTSFFIIGMQFLAFLIFIDLKRWKYPFILLITIGILYSPYVFTFLGRLGNVSSDGTWVLPPGWGEIYGSINLMLNSKWMVVVLILISAVLALITKGSSITRVYKKVRSDRPFQIILLWFSVPYLSMYFISIFWIPIFIERYLLYLTPALFIIVGVAINEMYQTIRFKWALIATIFVGSIATTQFNPTNGRNISSAVKYVKGMKTNSSKVFVCPDHFRLAFCYHYSRNIFNDVNPQMSSDPMAVLDKKLQASGIYPVMDITRSMVSDSKSIIYFDADAAFTLPLNKNLETILSQHDQVDSAHFEVIFNVYRFEKRQLNTN